MSDLKFIVDDLEIGFTFIDKNPETKQKISDSAPIEGTASKWGDEIYFESDVDISPENTQTEIPVGGVAFWPAGNAVCIFWGPTPSSKNDEPRAAGPVNLFGEIDDIDKIKQVDPGSTVRLE